MTTTGRAVGSDRLFDLDTLPPAGVIIVRRLSRVAAFARAEPFLDIYLLVAREGDAHILLHLDGRMGGASGEIAVDLDEFNGIDTDLVEQPTIGQGPIGQHRAGDN